MTVNEHIIRIGVVAVQSRIDAFSAPKLREQLDKMNTGGINRFVIDLGSVPFIDSAGLAVLVSLLKRTRLSGGDVTLVWPKDEGAQRILRLTKFDRVFTLTEDVPSALKP